MTHDPHQNIQPVFRIDVSATSSEPEPEPDTDAEIVTLLREMVSEQRRQSQILDELSQNLGATQKQRATELGQWKDANPELAHSCRTAAETKARAAIALVSGAVCLVKIEGCLLNTSDAVEGKQRASIPAGAIFRQFAVLDE